MTVDQRAKIEFYKQIIQVQMHFNDLCIRTRWLAVTVLTASLGSAVYMLKNGDLIFEMIVCEWKIVVPASAFILLAGVVVIWVIKRIDRGYYQKLLLAAVHYGSEVESNDKELQVIFGNRIGLNNHLLVEVPEGGALRKISNIYVGCYISLIGFGVAILAIFNILK